MTGSLLRTAEFEGFLAVVCSQPVPMVPGVDLAQPKIRIDGVDIVSRRNLQEHFPLAQRQLVQVHFEEKLTGGIVRGLMIRIQLDRLFAQGLRSISLSHAPQGLGLEVLAELRRRDETRDVGVILLTARREEVDRVRGLSEGADDYLTKPFSPAELVLRVKAVLRRLAAPAQAGGQLLQVGALSVDRAALAVTVDGAPVELTPIEYRLLLTLLERRGRVQSRPHLLETVWQSQPDLQTRTVDMHVNRLRAKLGAAGELIETVRGFGYRLREPVARERRR